jgi:hypothetical protein
MDATPPTDPQAPDPQMLAKAHRARLILFAVMALLIALPVLLFLCFHL